MYSVDNRDLDWSYGNFTGDDYYIFVLGYDILPVKFKGQDIECVEAFETACDIYQKFVQYDKINNTYNGCSTYDALWDFADKYIDAFYIGDKKGE